MKLKIDSEGKLLIERAGKWVNQFCPFNSENNYCSDSCPLFGEPEGSTLKICDIKTLFGQITDERGINEKVQS